MVGKHIPQPTTKVDIFFQFIAFPPHFFYFFLPFYPFALHIRKFSIIFASVTAYPKRGYAEAS